MAQHINSKLSRLNWKEAREMVSAVNPELASAIDELDPSDDFPLYHVKYPYGELMLDQSVVTLPTADGMYLPVSNDLHPQIVRDELSYSPTMPGTLVLKNKLECFCMVDGKLTPVFTVGPGRLMGFTAAINLEAAIDHNKIWNISAGIRSMFMLAPIGDNIAHNRLMREYDLHVSAPKNLQDQWAVFKNIVAQSDSEWEVEMIYFGRQWCEEKGNDKWNLFRYFLYERIWPIVRRESYFRLSELFLSQIQSSCNLRADPHLIGSTNHLIHIANSVSPAYGVLDDESGAPVSLLQDIYQADYRLPYAPLIMGSMYYHESDVVYYSLELPSNANATIRSRKRITRIEELREIRRTMQAIQYEILRNTMELEDREMSILRVAKSTQFQYLHSEATENEPILRPKEAINLDEKMAQQVSQFEVPFCENSRFFWGTVLFKHQSY